MLTDKYLKLQAAYFRLLGFDIFANSGSSDQWVYPYRTIYCFMSVLTFLPLTVAFCIQNMQNVDQLTDGLCSVLIDILVMFKFGLIFWLHKDIGQLIDRIRSRLLKASRESISAKLIDRSNQREQFISGLYKNCFLLAAASAFLLHLIGTMGTFIRSGSIEELPAPSVYPWDNRRVFNYLVSYVWNVSAALSVVLTTVCVDTLFCSLTQNLCALFQITQNKMKQCVAVTWEETQSNLADVLPLYQDNLNLFDTLNRCFRPLISVQFLVASLHLCVLSFQVSTNLNKPDVLFYAAFTCSILGQIYLYCYCGECVQTENENMAFAIYDSGWYETRGSWSAIGQPLLISMIRAQRGCRITGYFFEANMETFLWIVNTSMSYFTLLQSIS